MRLEWAFAIAAIAVACGDPAPADLPLNELSTEGLKAFCEQSLTERYTDRAYLDAFCRWTSVQDGAATSDECRVAEAACEERVGLSDQEILEACRFPEPYFCGLTTAELLDCEAAVRRAVEAGATTLSCDAPGSAGPLPTGRTVAACRPVVSACPELFR